MLSRMLARRARQDAAMRLAFILNLWKLLRAGKRRAAAAPARPATARANAR